MDVAFSRGAHARGWYLWYSYPPGCRSPIYQSGAIFISDFECLESLGLRTRTCPSTLPLKKSAEKFRLENSASERTETATLLRCAAIRPTVPISFMDTTTADARHTNPLSLYERHGFLDDGE